MRSDLDDDDEDAVECDDDMFQKEVDVDEDDNINKAENIEKGEENIYKDDFEDYNTILAGDTLLKSFDKLELQ